jgi:U3 small nucleolar RNA-associated protein 7
MATSALDGHMKVWDIRTFKPVHDYYTPTPATGLDISQKGLLAAIHGPHVTVRVPILFIFLSNFVICF